MLAWLLLGLQPATVALPVDRGAEVRPQPPAGALEAELPSPALPLYQDAMRALRAGRQRDALSLLRQARAHCYRAYVSGPLSAPARRRAYRHLIRTLYAEEEVQELGDIERQLERLGDRLGSEERMLLLHERALLLHNELLLVRAFTGQLDERMLGRALSAYEEVLGRQSPLRLVAQVGYAALLGERGDRRGAQVAIARLSPEEQAAERLDLPMAYFYAALGDRTRAVARLLLASRRDSWDRPSATQDGRTLRAMVYRMNDFDRLRDHPRFIELVSEPEERDAVGR